MSESWSMAAFSRHNSPACSLESRTQVRHHSSDSRLHLCTGLQTALYACGPVESGVQLAESIQLLTGLTHLTEEVIERCDLVGIPDGNQLGARLLQAAVCRILRLAVQADVRSGIFREYRCR